MVRPVGVEPTTYGLEVRCSIQLSYRRTDAEDYTPFPTDLKIHQNESPSKVIY